MGKNSPIKIVSLFSGAGGLDLGFEQAGFSTVWANEYDRTIWATFEKNFPNTLLDQRSITNISHNEIPYTDGLVGGPPCQSWSEAGAGRGIDDSRGKLFRDYIRILKEKKPKFFLCENVGGMLLDKHKKNFEEFIGEFEKAGYIVSWKLIDAIDFCVPQNRKRVIIVGYRNDLNKKFEFPKPIEPRLTLRNAIWDLRQAQPAKKQNKSWGDELPVSNHEYMNGDFSTIYMSRNRVRSWDEPSFTIQAGGRHAPIHPQAPKMLFIEQNKRVFVPGKKDDYRRLSVRECARIQTFPDTFVFIYNYISDGYKMVGNAVPVLLAKILASKIKEDLYK